MSGTQLPQAEKPDQKSGLHPSFYILNWMFFSNVTILFNKWLLDSAGFRYPILLTAWHLVFATVATQILARTTSLLDSRKNLPMNGRLYLRTILPIGVLYSGSLVFSNVVYLYLSVAFIQMLKAMSPVAVLFCSWAWGVAEPNMSRFINIAVIVSGVALSSFGEVQFSLIGFMFQLGGVICEAVRLVMIEVMLSGQGLRMDPLVGLYYYAPVCAVMNIVVAWASEIPHFEIAHAREVGWLMLFISAVFAFMLNIASVFLIGKTSGLVMTLTGMLKNMVLVVISVIIWNTKITLIQGVGYSIAIGGLIYYSLGYDTLATGAKSAAGWSSMVWNDPTSRGHLPKGARRSLIIVGGLVMTLFSVVMVLRAYEVDVTQPLSMLPSLSGSS